MKKNFDIVFMIVGFIATTLLCNFFLKIEMWFAIFLGFPFILHFWLENYYLKDGADDEKFNYDEWGLKDVDPDDLMKYPSYWCVKLLHVCIYGLMFYIVIGIIVVFVPLIPDIISGIGMGIWSAIFDSSCPGFFMRGICEPY